jgi:hypothetical protein
MANTKVKDFTPKATMVDTDEFYGNDAAGGDADALFTSLVFKTYTSLSPTLVTPALGTPASGVLSGCTGATTSAKGVVELATIAEVDTGTDTTRAVTPDALEGSALQIKVDGVEALADVTDLTNVNAAAATVLGTIATGVWQGTAIASAFLDADTAHLSTTQTFTGAKTFNEDITLSTASIKSATDVETSTVSANDGSLAITIADSTGVSTFVSGTVLVAPVLGTPASGVLTNCTGTAAGLTAGTVTTNANLTGDVTSSGNATTIAAKAVDVAMLADGTDGELITWSATGVAAVVAVGTATHVLTSNGIGVAPTFQAAGGSGNTFARIVKKADETITSSTVMQDDDELKFTPTINKTYGILLMLFINSHTTPDFKYAVTVPTGATALKIDGQWSSSTNRGTLDWETADEIGGFGADEVVSVWGRLIMSSNAGDFTVQWAQQNSDANDTKVLQGSYLVAWEET